MEEQLLPHFMHPQQNNTLLACREVVNVLIRSNQSLTPLVIVADWHWNCVQPTFISKQMPNWMTTSQQRATWNIFHSGNGVIIVPQHDANSLIAFDGVIFSTLRCYMLYPIIATDHWPERLQLLMEEWWCANENEGIGYWVLVSIQFKWSLLTTCATQKVNFKQW